VLWLLFNRRELCVCEVMAVLEITQSKASRHLAALRHIGIAKDRKDGLWSYYSLCAPADELAKNHLKLLRSTLTKHPDAKLLLEKLSMWLKEKNRGASCINNRASTKPKAKGASIRTLLQERLHEQ
jgi:ArsR family transcriptional regulator